MQLISPSVEYIPQEAGYDGMIKHIEKCGRICYKSEDKITDSSAQGFVARMIKAGHTAMLEHGTIYLALPVETILPLEANDWGRYYHNPYSDAGTVCEVKGQKMVAATTNFRVIVENDWYDDLKYAFNPTKYHKRRYTMKFTCARIDSQSITRYRHNSFAQESQRFINYLQKMRGATVTFCEPIWVKPEDLEELKQDAAISEQLYFKWLNKGYKPEEARYFLINGTKTEIIVTAFEDDWRYFLDQRLRNTTGKPSSNMHHLAQLLWNEFKEKLDLEL